MTSYLSEWLSSINQQTASVGEDVEKRGPSCTVCGMEKSMKGSQKVKDETAL